MCPNTSLDYIIQQGYTKKSKVAESSGIIRQYTPPTLKENGAGAYIEFFAFDPERGQLRRKTIKKNLDTIEDGLMRYDQYIKKMLASGLWRKETSVGYRSYTKIC